jgi:hypothetical protein
MPDTILEEGKIVSISTVLYPRWPPLLKIEISSNGQNCSILSQNVRKKNFKQKPRRYAKLLLVM